MQTEIILEARIGASQHLDIGSGREEFFALAPHNEHVHGFVHACCQNRLVELAHHLVAVGVGRGMIELDDCQPMFHPIVHELSQHGCPPPPLCAPIPPCEALPSAQQINWLCASYADCKGLDNGKVEGKRATSR